MEHEVNNLYRWTEEDEDSGVCYLVEGGNNPRTIALQFVDEEAPEEIKQWAIDATQIRSIHNFNGPILIETVYDGDERYFSMDIDKEFRGDFLKALIKAWNKARSV